MSWKRLPIEELTLFECLTFIYFYFLTVCDKCQIAVFNTSWLGEILFHLH